MPYYILHYYNVLMYAHVHCILQAISKCTIEGMAVAVAGGGGSLVLALSAAGGELLIVAPAAEVTWTAVGSELSGKSVKRYVVGRVFSVLSRTIYCMYLNN